MEIRLLIPADRRDTFQSGDPYLDRYFHLYAGQNQFRHYSGATYVACEGAQILGYVTVSPASIEVERLPVAARRGLPNYPLPALRLARLAVDHRARGKRIGEMLLRHTAKLARKLADDYGCVGIVVDAKPDAVAFYARYGFIETESLEGELAERPQPTPMFIALRMLRVAEGPGSPPR